MEKSKNITGIHVGEALRYSASWGDVWTTAWTANDCLYAVSDDTTAWSKSENIMTNLAFSKITGDHPDNLDGTTVNHMLEYGKACEIKPMPEGDGCCWKASGCVCVDDIIYIGVSRHLYGTHKAGFHQLTSNASFAKSADYGKTWTPTAEENYSNPMFPGPFFSNPYIIDYGKNGWVPEGFTQPDNSDKYIYAVSNDGAWNNGNAMRLARVLRSKLSDLNGSDWEFYRGTDGNMDGTLDLSWSHDINKSGTILYKDDCISMNGATYIPALNQYIMVQWYYPYLSEYKYYASVFDFYMAPHPWGPWNKVSSYDCTPFGYYNPTIPSKFISKDGLNMSVFTNGDFSYLSYVPEVHSDEDAAIPYCLTVIPITLDTEEKAPKAEPENKCLINNPSFEKGAIGWKAANVLAVAPNWPSKFDIYNHTIATKNVYSGKCAGRIIEAGSRLWQDIIGLKPSTQYRLMAYAKVRSENDELWVGVEGHGNNEVHVSVNNTEYKKVTIDFTTSKQSACATIFLYKNAGIGEAWFDEFDLIEM